MKKDIYIISGLGVDERAFEKIQLHHYNVHFLKWIPAFPNESMTSYAQRMSQNIVGAQPKLIGLSFGGMIASEIATFKSIHRLILIASAQNKFQLPFIYRICGMIGLNKIIPIKLLKQHNFITNYFFGAKLNEDKMLLKEILRDTDDDFLKWAINSIINWEKETFDNNVIHIHGNKDLIIPISAKHQITYEVKNAGHFITNTHAAEISKILNEVIQ